MDQLVSCILYSSEEFGTGVAEQIIWLEPPWSGQNAKPSYLRACPLPNQMMFRMYLMPSKIIFIVC